MDNLIESLPPPPEAGPIDEAIHAADMVARKLSQAKAALYSVGPLPPVFLCDREAILAAREITKAADTLRSAALAWSQFQASLHEARRAKEGDTYRPPK